MEDQKNTVKCRVCLDCDSDEEQSKCLSLFEKYNDCVISNKINALTNVGIEEGDGLPDRICPTCLLDLESAFKFKLKCESSNEVLLSAVNNVPTLLEASDDVADPIKEEYLEDDNVDSVDDDDDISLPELAVEDHELHAEMLPSPGLKEEYLDDDNVDSVDEDDNISLPELPVEDHEIDAEMLPRPSRAIDLKLECHDCGGSFTSKCKLRVHWKNAHMPDKLKCPSCCRKFKTYATLNLHKKRNLKSCVTASKFHIEGEGRNRVFHCKECSYQTLNIFEMSQHNVRHTGERLFQCNICPKSFSQLGSLLGHKERIHKVYTSEGTCQYCGRHIQGRIRLSEHVRRHRDREKCNSYECKICKKVLKTKDGLSNHTKRHSGIKAFVCEICSYSFFTSGELSCHKTKIHLKSKIYSCDQCKYTSRDYGSMSRHKWKHSASNISCNVCGFFVENEQQLALHMMRHTDRKHQCSLCEKTYFSRKNLCTHHRKKHKIIMLNAPKDNTEKRKNLIKKIDS